jgi:hypothetical protein
LERLRHFWDLAADDTERRLLLSALGDLAGADALTFAQAAMRHDALLNESATAVASIARRLAAYDAPRAQQALAELDDRPLSPAAMNLVRQARDFILRHDGYIARWSYAGPFTLDGGDYAAVFAHGFPPEQPEAGGGWRFVGPDGAPAGWRPLDAAAGDNPWQLDLTLIDRGSNRCIYAGALVWSSRAQPARLQIGSDDGVRVWLNGALVHSNPPVRALRADEDIVNVELEGGWNTLLLKVAQGSGGWGFTCGIRDREGRPLDGLIFGPTPSTDALGTAGQATGAASAGPE